MGKNLTLGSRVRIVGGGGKDDSALREMGLLGIEGVVTLVAEPCALNTETRYEINLKWKWWRKMIGKVWQVFPVYEEQLELI